jgi:hypothetical protein
VQEVKTMPKRRYIHLNQTQLDELEQIVRTDEKAYRRERAAAILKIADGRAAHWVAQHGLLVRRAPDRVYEWLNRYETEGAAGLTMRSGRGRKPAFSP